MYEAYYKLKAMPFQITTDPRFLWLGEKHSEALATLKYGIMENKGFLLLTGDVGTGKTALINRLIKMIDVAAIVAKIPDPGLSSLDFFNFLAVEFKINKKFDSKGAFLIYLKNFLHKAYAAHKKVLLIIDEAQRLNHELLEQIRLLSNIELQNRKLINIFFVGQPEFNEMLREDRNRAVRQRIGVNYHINPLSAAEAHQYIEHRLKVAGATRPIFEKDAIREIYSFSGGYPRLINIICDHALLTGYASDLTTINKKVIKECERELQIPVDIDLANGNGQKVNPTPKTPPASPVPVKPSRIKQTSIIAALIMLLVFGIYFLVNQKSGDSPRWSMDEIAPQKYKGETPEMKGTGNTQKVKTSKIKPVAPVKAVPLEKKSVESQSQKMTTVQKIEPAPGPAEKQTPVPFPFDENKVLIYFKHNSNELPDQSFEMLNKIAAYMIATPGSSINIKGYTDSTGSYTYNVSVSEFRANTIKTFLVGKGVGAERIKTLGMGPENPIASNKTETGRRKNRRVEIELVN
ncbi:MAG: AAA family ATPase [Desulfobacterales bacterium]